MHKEQSETPQASSTLYVLRVVMMVTLVAIVPKSSRSDSTRSVWVEDCRATPLYNGGEPESSEVLSDESKGVNTPLTFAGTNLHICQALGASR
jgi:hypothetical protein